MELEVSVDGKNADVARVFRYHGVVDVQSVRVVEKGYLSGREKGEREDGFGYGDVRWWKRGGGGDREKEVDH